MNPPEPTPPRVFISYAWKNQPVAKQLQRDLIRDAVEVFVDYEMITGGDSLPARISAALEWCNTLVLLWSVDSAHSYYVSQEWESAFHLQKRIIPCVLDGTELPAVLRRLLYLNFSNYETGYAQLCRSLSIGPKAGSREVPFSESEIKLPMPQAEISAKEPKPPQTGQLTRPPLSTQQHITVSDAPAAKPKRQQPLVDKTISVQTGRSVEKLSTPPWWRRNVMTNITLLVILIGIALVFYNLMCSSNNLHLRSERKQVLYDNVKEMFNARGFYDSNRNKEGKGIKHRYELITRSGQQLIIDHATGLTWQQAGSQEAKTYKQPAAYIDSLCRVDYGGYSNWRLPTLEEAMSLLEPVKKNGALHIDPKFEPKQWAIWTADTFNSGWMWVVYFGDGTCDPYHGDYSYHVRAVR